MLIESASFHKFTVVPERIIRSIPAYSPNSWGPGWEIVHIKSIDILEAMTWATTNAIGRMDHIGLPDGGTLFAFSDATDAMMFKITFI